MQKKWVVILNIIILVIVTFFLSLFALQFFSEPEEVVDSECIEVNKVTSFVYESCYDVYTKTIFINVERSPDTYNLKSFEFSFFDVDQQAYKISDVPNVGESKAYKITAEKNPENLNVRMNIIKDFSAEVCEEPRIIFVGYCPSRVPGEEEISGDISPFRDVSPNSFIEVSDFDQEGSDTFSMSLVDKEAVWETQCSSSWACSDWEACVDGVQKRSCQDTRECQVPTNKPDTVRYCDGTCKENWECTWEECRNGFTVPECTDVNRCGTTFELPQKLSCGEESLTCVPDIVCGDWTSCEVDYNFLDLVGGAITDLTGSKSRLCVDRNKCSVPQEESRECSVNVDVYTKRFIKCGKEYIGIYNRLDNDLIARVDIGTDENPHLNLFLDDQADSEYCDYCFNGVMDGDETGIDCGGGCMSCDEKYGDIDYEISWWDRLLSW